MQGHSGIGSVTALLFRAVTLPMPLCHPCEPLKFTVLGVLGD